MSAREPHVAVVVAFGPEVRSLIFSGLVERLARRMRVTVLTPNPHSAAFRSLPPGVAVVALPTGAEPRALGRLRGRALGLQRAWQERRGMRKWSHYAAPGAPRSILGRAGRRVAGSWTVRLATALERTAGAWAGTDAAVAECFTALGIDALLASSYSTGRMIPLLQTAHNLGIATVIATNSWKDVHTQAHVPVPLTRLLLWTREDVAELRQRNPLLRAGRVDAVGSLHLDAVRRAPVMPRDEFCAAAGLDPARPILCYTAASPAAVDGEIETVAALARDIASARIAHRPQLVIRTNPMEDGTRFASLAGLPGVVVQRPEWEWNAADDWCCTLPGDLRTWASTIAHSAANVSIPSTVTLEFAIQRKPVLNVCFDTLAGVAPERSASRFWEADFYASMRGMPGVLPVFSHAELVARVERVLGATAAPAGESPALDALAAGAVEAVERHLDEVLQAGR